MREDMPGEKRLVAYVVTSERQETPSAGALIEALRDRLPDYMLPGVVVFLDRFPMTANGKIDRAALPQAQGLRTYAAQSLRPPRDEFERALADIWESLLEVSPIGMDDNFFGIGGHSLLALRLQSEVRQRFGVGFPLPALFENATIAHLASVIRARLASGEPDAAGLSPIAEAEPASGRGGNFGRWLRRLFGGASPPDGGRASKLRAIPHEQAERLLVPIQKGLPGRSPLFLVHPVGGQVLCYGELAHALGQDHRVVGLSSVALPAEDRTIEGLAERYAAAARMLQPEGPVRLGGWSMGGLIAYEMARCMVAKGEEVELLVLIDSFPAEHAEEATSRDERELLARYTEDLLAQHDLPLAAPWNLELPEGGKGGPIAPALAALRASGVLSEDMDEAAFELGWREYRGNHHAWARYRPGPYLGRMHLLMAADSLVQQGRTPLKVWGALAIGGLGMEVLPGGHYSLIKRPTVRLVAERLALLLGQHGSSSDSPAETGPSGRQ